MSTQTDIEMQTMKTLFTDRELKELIHDINIAYVDMMDSEIHTQEVSWIVHDLEIFATVVCVRETLTEPHQNYDHQELGSYIYHFEIEDAAVYFNGEDCISYDQLEDIVIPVLDVKIHIYGQ